MQWSKSEIVRSEAEDHGEVNEESDRYLCEWPEIDSPAAGGVFTGVATVDGAVGGDGDTGEAAGLAAFRLNANFALGAVEVRAPSKPDSIDLIFYEPYKISVSSKTVYGNNTHEIEVALVVTGQVWDRIGEVLPQFREFDRRSINDILSVPTFLELLEQGRKVCRGCWFRSGVRVEQREDADPARQHLAVHSIVARVPGR